MEQQSISQPRQKVITLLHRSYSQALKVLKLGKFVEGVQLLERLLQHQFINDTDTQNIKYSTLMSLAEVQQALGCFQLALGYYWQSLQILHHKSQQSLKGQIISKQHNEERVDEQFTALLKMIFIVEKLNLEEQLIYLLKRAIKISPNLWREKLISKLQQVYEREGKTEALTDLLHLIQNKDQMEMVICQKQQFQQKTSEETKNHLKILKIAQSQETFLKKIVLKVNISESDDILLKYSNWETLLTLSYILLKCQNVRNFNKKKYLHKKYDQGNKQWNLFLKKFSITRTKIEIAFIKPQTGLSIIECQNEHEINWSKIVEDLGIELMKYKYLKKKSKKVSNPLQQLTRIPSLNSKDPKKIITAQTKSIFTSVYQYYKELLSKVNFPIQILYNLSIFNRESFSNIFGKIINDEHSQEMKPQGEQNQEEDIQGSFSMGGICQEPDKDSVKVKKTLKQRKLEIIAQNNQLNHLIPSVLGDRIESERITYENTIEMIEKITAKLIKQMHHKQKKLIVLNNIAIRKILQKNILKILQVGQGFFSDLNQSQFFDLLMQKLETLTDKECKSKIFKNYQDQKRIIISNFIKQRFLPKTYQIQEILQQSLSLNQLRYISHICQGFCKFYSLQGMSVPNQVSFYRQLYIIFKKQLQLKMGNRFSNEGELEKILTYYIDKQIQKFQKKAASKINIVNMKEQAEENVNSIDQIYKKDKQISAVLPLLKVLNCHPQQAKTGKSAQTPEQFNGSQYLQAFIKLSELFFKKIQLESYKQFNCRLLILVSQIMRIKQVIAQVYQKFVVNNIFLKTFDISKEIYTQTLYYLIRFYLLNLYEENDNCLRISFILTNTLLRQQPESQKFYLVPKLICTFDQLIKYKKWPPQTLNSIRKRFYQNLMLKNLIFIYKGPLLMDSEKPKQYNKRYEKNKYARSDSQQQLNIQHLPKSLELENQDIKDRVFDIIHDVYFSPEKDRQFNPKRMQQAIGYFMYLLHAYHEIFQRKIIVLENDAIKIFKKCYRLYMDRRGQVYNYCQSFKIFKNTFETFMNGEDSKIQKNDFISIIKQQKPICTCCCSLNRTHPFYVETLFVLGKYFQAQSLQPQLYLSKQLWLQQINKDQDYYFDYLALNLDKQSAWQNIVRVNCTKSFYYFDSLLKQPFQKYKSKFLYTKRIIHFVNEHYPHFQDLTVFGSANLQILNILKIKEREYLMIQKKVQLCGSENKQSKQLQKKYKQGVKRILQSNNKFIVDDVRIRYLRFSQIKLKLHWINLQKQVKEEKVSEAPVIIQLDQQSSDSKIIHKPTKNIEHINQLLDEAKFILKELPIQQENDYVNHLQEDIVMECYIFLCKHLEWKLENVITSLCQSINTNHSQKNKKIKQAEFMISDINYTLQFFKHGNFITNNPRYKLKDQNLMISSSQFTTIQSTFSNIFSNNQSSLQKQPEHIPQKQTIQKEQIIVINDQQNEEINPQINRQRMDQQSKSVKRSNSNKSISSKGAPKSKTLVLDVGTYLYGRFVRYIIQNKLFVHPLNHLQTFLYSQSIQQIIVKMTKILMEVSRVIIQLPKYQIKKFRNRRSVVLSLIYCSHLSIKFAKNQDRTYQLIKEYVNTKSDEIVLINLHNQKICAEKNQLLSDFYNRCIVHQIMKIQFIRHIFNVYVAQGNKDALVMLNRKLLKLSKINETKIDKDKNIKNPTEDTLMQIEGNKSKELSQIQVIQINTSRQSKESKDSIITNNLSKQSKQSEKSLEYQFYYLLFCEGVIQFVQILKKEAQIKPIEEKYEKNLLQFKNRIKRNIKLDEKSIFFGKIDQFVTRYQQKYNKKIKMKRPRKEKQGVNLPIIDQKSKQIEAIQFIQKMEIPINFHLQRKQSASQNHSQSNQQKSPRQVQPKKERKIKKDQKQICGKIVKKFQSAQKKGQKNNKKQVKKLIIPLIDTVVIPLQIPSQTKQKQLLKQSEQQKTQKKVQTVPKIERPKREIKSKGLQLKKSQ